MFRSAVFEVDLDEFEQAGRDRHRAVLVALAPHLDSSSIEVDVANPQPSELDPAEAETFGQSQRQLVEQRVTSGSRELAEQRRLLDGVGATARLGS